MANWSSATGDQCRRVVSDPAASCPVLQISAADQLRTLHSARIEQKSGWDARGACMSALRATSQMVSRWHCGMHTHVLHASDIRPACTTVEVPVLLTTVWFASGLHAA